MKPLKYPRMDSLIVSVWRRDRRCCRKHLAGSNDYAGQRVPRCDDGVLELLGAMLGTERLYGLKQWPD